MASMDTLTIKTENKFRSLVTKQAYTKGEVICEIPTEKVVSKPNEGAAFKVILPTTNIPSDFHPQYSFESDSSYSID